MRLRMFRLLTRLTSAGFWLGPGVGNQHCSYGGSFSRLRKAACGRLCAVYTVLRHHFIIYPS